MGKDYNISKSDGRCGSCGRELAPGEEFVAIVREAEDEYRRDDFCAACWQERADAERPDCLGVWRSRVPEPEQKKGTFIADERLIDLFEQLEGAAEPMKVGFRFVLALVLMRKKLLAYDASAPLGDGREQWTMHLRGTGKVYKVINPRMDDEKIAAVSRNVSQILEAEL